MNRRGPALAWTRHGDGASVTAVDPVVLGTVAALGAVTLVLIFVADGNVGVALAPVAVLTVVAAVLRFPLRHSLLVLGFLCLTLESPGDVAKWKSPLYAVGALMLAHLNYTVPIKALFFSGADLAILLLVGVWVARRMSASPLDVRGSIAPVEPLRYSAWLCLATIAVVWAYGLARSGADWGMSLWQVSKVVYLPLVFLLYCVGVRGQVDARALGGTLIAAALVRALMAVWIRHLYPDTDAVPHATSHPDSMLFVDALFLLVALVFEQPTRRNLRLLLATAPIIAWGMVANNRRLAWLELMLGLLTFYFITPFTAFKRRIVQVISVLVPVIAIYSLVGWNSSSRFFAPVRMMRSVVDSESDGSALWRDLENYDLAWTFSEQPLLGTGFGHPFEEKLALPDIRDHYPLERFVPHNSVLAGFAFGGVIGFVGTWLIIALGMFFAVRVYRVAHLPRERAAALTTVGILVAYVVHCYGDLGLGTWTSVFTVGPALALVGKLAVTTGAWPARRRGAMRESTTSLGTRMGQPQSRL